MKRVANRKSFLVFVLTRHLKDKSETVIFVYTNIYIVRGPMDAVDETKRSRRSSSVIEPTPTNEYFISKSDSSTERRHPRRRTMKMTFIVVRRRIPNPISFALMMFTCIFGYRSFFGLPSGRFGVERDFVPRRH